MIEFIIAGRLDGLNDYTKANRANAYGGNSIKQRNEKIVKSAILNMTNHAREFEENRF